MRADFQGSDGFRVKYFGRHAFRDILIVATSRAKMNQSEAEPQQPAI